MKKVLFMLAGFLFSHIVIAESLHYQIINLDATAQTEVANDELIAQLQVIRSGSDATRLSQEVNRQTARVLDQLKAYPDIEARTTAYQTRPIYRDSKISSWQVTQTINLRSKDFDAMSQLLGDIADMANIASLQFQLSDSLVENTRNRLMTEAIQKFRDKASLIQQQFGEPGYRLVNLSVDTGHYFPQPAMERGMLMSADMAVKSSAPVALEAGSNTVSVTVRGTIQLVSDPSQISP